MFPTWTFITLGLLFISAVLLRQRNAALAQNQPLLAGAGGLLPPLATAPAAPPGAGAAAFLNAMGANAKVGPGTTTTPLTPSAPPGTGAAPMQGPPSGFTPAGPTPVSPPLVAPSGSMVFHRWRGEVRFEGVREAQEETASPNGCADFLSQRDGTLVQCLPNGCQRQFSEVCLYCF